MNIVVLVKLVPDTESKLKLSNGAIDYSGINYIVNPYDEYAVEEAIKLVEQHGGTSTAVLIGNPREGKLLLNILAMGIDQVYIVDDPAVEGSDPLAVAKIIQKVIEGKPFDLVLAGKESVDYNWGMTAVALAELLNIPHTSLAINIEVSNNQVKVKKASDEGIETFEMYLPCLITCEKGLNEPRLPKLMGIMKAKKKPQTVLSLTEISIDPQTVGSHVSDIRIAQVAMPKEKPAGRIIDAENTLEKVCLLVNALREEARVI